MTSEVPTRQVPSPRASNQSHGHAGKTSPRPLPRSRVSENRKPHTTEDPEDMTPDLGSSGDQGERGGGLGRCIPPDPVTWIL